MSLSFASLPYKLIALGTILGALAGFHYIDKAHALDIQKKAFEARLELSIANARTETKETEKQLAQAALEGEQEKNEKLKSINDKLSSTIVSLQQRPTRPTSPAPITTVVQACTGRELFREDGEFLAREAALADQVVVERDFYYDQYERARAILAKQKPND